MLVTRKNLLHRATTLAVALLMTVAALALGVPALAAPSLYGPTGLIQSPTADVLEPNGFNFGLRLWEPMTILTFNMSPASNFEFGVTSYNWDNGAFQDSWVEGNLKFRFLTESKTSPALAAGITNITDDNRRLYLVGSKNIPQLGVRGHLGYESGGTGLFLGLSKQLNTVSIGKPGKKATPQTVFLAEIYGSNLNLGASIGLTPELAVDVFLMDMDQAALGVVYRTRF